MSTPSTASSEPQRPSLVTLIAVITLINGILNIFWGLGVTFLVAVTVIGLCATPVTILPTVLGIFEILYAAKLLATPPQPVRPSQTIAILEIACILVGNVFSMIVGILALVFYNDEAAKDYFARLNGMAVPPAPQPVTPPTQVQPEAPLPPPTDSQPATPTPQPPPAEPAAPKKPRIRKVAAAPSKPTPKAKTPGPRKSGSSSS